MISAAQLTHGANDPDMLVGILGIATVLCWGVWALIKQVRGGPAQPDPWDKNIAAEIEKEEAIPLCHRCLASHDASTDFCPTCGAAVGQYTNWLPYPYLFSLGHALRIGASGEFRRSPLTISFFFLFSLLEYTLFAPVYWILMLRSLAKHGGHAKTQHPSPTVSEKSDF